MDLDIFHLECVFKYSYFNKWLGMWIYPYAVLACLLLIGVWITHSTKTKKIWETVLYILGGFTCYLVVPHVQKNAVIWNCMPCAEGVKCLKDYPTIKCGWEAGDPTWTAMAKIAYTDLIFLFISCIICIPYALWKSCLLYTSDAADE